MEGFAGALAIQALQDCFGDVTAALYGDLRDPGKGFTAAVCDIGQIADDEDIGVLGNGEIGRNLDLSVSSGFGSGSSGEHAAEFRDGHSGGPEYGTRSEMLLLTGLSFQDHAFAINRSDRNFFSHLHAQFS